ncbi:hypothetical protein NDU88_003905 [Pleurodeles waltl]|uniref:Uncharacterized protein n=1 Tax=Pleurodeles waltl TaxID=8319 RepID=A0AAV7UEM1_PLEWA|nr:hypothetical protein NDU88_003905 [Pleurodeles waltl]
MNCRKKCPHHLQHLEALTDSSPCPSISPPTSGGVRKKADSAQKKITKQVSFSKLPSKKSYVYSTVPKDVGIMALITSQTVNPAYRGAEGRQYTVAVVEIRYRYYNPHLVILPQYRHPHKSATPKEDAAMAENRGQGQRSGAASKNTGCHQEEVERPMGEATFRGIQTPGPIPNVTRQEVPDISSPPTEEAYSDDSSSARLDQDDQPGSSGTSGQSVPLPQSQPTTDPTPSGNTSTAPTQRAHHSVARTRQSAVCPPLQGPQATPLTQDNEGRGVSDSGHTVQGTEAQDNREVGRTAVRQGEDRPREPTPNVALSNIMGAYHHSQETMGTVLAKFQETQRLQEEHYLGIREDLKSINTTLVTIAGVLADLLNSRRDTVAHQRAPDTSLDDEQPTTSAGASGQEGRHRNNRPTTPYPLQKENHPTNGP